MIAEMSKIDSQLHAHYNLDKESIQNNGMASGLDRNNKLEENIKVSKIRSQECKVVS